VDVDLDETRLRLLLLVLVLLVECHAERVRSHTIIASNKIVKSSSALQLVEDTIKAGRSLRR